jgi:alkylhydroperoxidase family enzyme
MLESPNPRITPMTDEGVDDTARSILDTIRPTGAPASNVFYTLVQHPRLTREFVRYGGRLMYGAISARDRELVILRIATRKRSAYEWGQHEIVAKSIGIDEVEIAGVAEGPDAACWSQDDRVLLTAVDQLLDEATIDDRTWKALSERCSVHELIELPLLVGHFVGVAFLVNALRVQPEPGLPPLRPPLRPPGPRSP